jgi:hypothetical protein
VDLIIFLTLTRLVVVINFVNFSFALFTPPSRRLSVAIWPRLLLGEDWALGEPKVCPLLEGVSGET